MQDRPEAGELLDAIGEFLLKELIPYLNKEKQDALSFKALVSWNMLSVLNREGSLAPAQLVSELTELSGVLKDDELAGRLKVAATENKSDAERREVLTSGLEALVGQIRRDPKSARPGTPEWQFAREYLKNQLAIVNPRFQTGD